MIPFKINIEVAQDCTQIMRENYDIFWMNLTLK